MQDLIKMYHEKTEMFKDLALLGLRLILAYGFYEPAMGKLQGFSDVVVWFRDGLHLPFPMLNAAMATGTEAIGVILLFLGLATRIISFPLMIVMIVAVVTVHGFDTFSAADNGFEIPLYYFLMLFVLMTHGAGKISMDATAAKKWFN